MGEEISHSLFGPDDFRRFGDRLREETRLFSDLSATGRLSQDGFVVGFEIEAWLLDHGFFPHPVNERFLETLSHPLVVPELSRFNVEMNCEPLSLTSDVLRRATAALTDLWTRCNAVAHSLDTNMVMIGTLPIIRDKDLTLANMSPLKRYEALNNEILRQRGGRPLVVEIDGEEHLHLEHRDVMLEAATTSFQIHLKTPARLAHRYYNASIMASAPLLAACVNAPFLFRRALWPETRIPLFEQSIPLTDRNGLHGRVSFGSGYLASSLFEALAENLDAYPVLLPIVFDEPPEAFRHLRLHNGTIWRWNRPLVGFEAGRTPHLRIEHRTLPAGPTIIDMIANAACYFGLVRHFVDTGFDEGSGLSFADATANFYSAARYGLDAQLVWPSVGRVGARALLLDELIPAAHRGLAAFQVDEDDRDLYLGIVESRARSGQTGAAWQRAERNRCGDDFRELMSVYCERQRSAAPVHQWEI
jgi:gamma-glutamyl:cysteine ligase YbdK (ATP-grasp superfamily)